MTRLVALTEAERRRSPAGAFLLFIVLMVTLAPSPGPARADGPVSADAPALDALRAELIASAQRVMLLHHELIGLDRDLADLTAREAEQAATLDQERRQLAASAGALYRLARLPPALVMAGPGDPADRVRATAVLSGVVPRLADHVRRAQRVLADLHDLRRTLEARLQERNARRGDLRAGLATLTEQIERRQLLLQGAGRQQDRPAEMATALATEARGLQAMLSDLSARRIGAGNRDMGAATAMIAPAPGGSPLTRPMLPLATFDGVVLPTSGLIVERFGEQGRFGDPSQGIRLSAYPGAPVVAPIDGTVRYAGDFEPYGQILILEHSGGYHSLIAGLSRIDVAEGQSVLAGEPVAIIPSPDGGRNDAPTLYYELRLNGRPTDPVRGLLQAQQRGQG